MNSHINKISVLSRDVKSIAPLLPKYYCCLHPIKAFPLLAAAGLIYMTYRDVLGLDSDKQFPHSPIEGNQCHALVHQNISVQTRFNNIELLSRDVFHLNPLLRSI